MKIEGKKEVTMNYSVKDENGTVVDHGDNVKFVVGAGSLLPHFEENLNGMSEGDKKEFVLKPNEAYGEYKLELIQKVPRSKFNDQENELLVKGKTLQMYTKDGMPLIATVKEVDDKDVTFDFNHPLAGKTLTFNVEIVKVSEPTQ